MGLILRNVPTVNKLSQMKADIKGTFNKYLKPDDQLADHDISTPIKIKNKYVSQITVRSGIQTAEEISNVWNKCKAGD